MDITLDKKSSIEASIKVKIDEADYQSKVEEKVKDYSKKASIKGFRPGKVPPALIKKMYGKSILVEEINNQVGQALNNYIKENKLQIIGDPLPDEESGKNIDWDNQRDFEFDFNIGLVEDFTYDLSSCQVVTYDVESSEDELSESIDRFRKQYGQMVHPESSQAGDFLYGELKQGDVSIAALIPNEVVSKEVADKFTGLKKEETVTFNLREAFANDEDLVRVTGKHLAEVQELDGEFEFRVDDISRGEPAELNQDFFDKMFGPDVVHSEEEMKEKLSESYKKVYQRQAESKFLEDIKKALTETTHINLPDEFLKRWLLATNESKVTAEDVEKEFDSYVKELKWMLIKNRIAEDNNVSIQAEDLINDAKELLKENFANSGMASVEDEEVEKMAMNYLYDKKGENYMKFYNEYKTKKIIEILREKAQVEVKKVNQKEFTESFLN